eukprot:gene19668-biopygen27471
MAADAAPDGRRPGGGGGPAPARAQAIPHARRAEGKLMHNGSYRNGLFMISPAVQRCVFGGMRQRISRTPYAAKTYRNGGLPLFRAGSIAGPLSLR